MVPLRGRRIRFGPFELDVRTGELRKGGTRLRVPDQSVQILQTLLERAGDLVTREELRARLWPAEAETFVDFDHGLNSAVRRLRDVLGDSADAPKFVETLPRRGYRFIGTIQIDEDAPDDRAVATTSAPPLNETTPPSPPAVPAAIAARVFPRRWLVAAATLLILALSVAALSSRWLDRRGAAAWAEATHLTFDDGLQTDPGFSADGHSIVYAGDAAGNFDIWTQRMADDGNAIGNPVRVTTNAALDWQPDWSPDGNRIVFRSERGAGGLFLVPATGGPETPLVDFGYRPQWSPDGRLVLFARSILIGLPSPLSFVNPDDGVVHDLQPSGGAGAFGWTPDSHEVAVLSGHTRPAFRMRLVSTNVGTRERIEWTLDERVRAGFRQLGVRAGERLQWTKDGRSIFFIGDLLGAQSVWRIDVDAAAHHVVGGPFRVTSTLHDASNFSLSRDEGRIAFDGAPRTARLWAFELDGTGGVRDGREQPVSLEAADADQPDLSRDGTKLVFQRALPGSRQQRELVTRDMTTGREDVLRVIDSGREYIAAARWDTAGARLSYTVTTPMPSGEIWHQIRLLDPATGRETALTSPTRLVDFPAHWMPDDRHVVANGPRYAGVDGGFAIVLLPIDAAPHAETAARIVTSVAKGGLVAVTVSPDGRWIAFRAVNMPGVSSRLAIVSADGGDQSSWIVIDGGIDGDKPRWSAAGDVLYFTRREGVMQNVWSVGFDSAHGRVIGRPRQVTAFNSPAAYVLPNLWTLEIGVGGNHLVVPVVRPKGGIWVAKREGR
jgi:Tol biopolymer transport system component/DNA-binding winged helix-turn-helix (wHTH) protein